MTQVRGDEAIELGDKLVHALGRQIEPEELDRHESFALGIVPAKNRSKGSCTDLMKNTIGSEGIWGRRAGSFSVQ